MVTRIWTDGQTDGGTEGRTDGRKDGGHFYSPPLGRGTNNNIDNSDIDI